MRTLVLLLPLGLITGCSGPECGAITPHVNVRVVDLQTQSPVSAAMFTESGNALTAGCSSYTNSCVGGEASFDAGAACEGWLLDLSGMHNVTVSAAAYAPKTVSMDTGIVQTECGLEPANCIALTVALVHN